MKSFDVSPLDERTAWPSSGRTTSAAPMASPSDQKPISDTTIIGPANDRTLPRRRRRSLATAAKDAHTACAQ